MPPHLVEGPRGWKAWRDPPVREGASGSLHSRLREGLCHAVMGGEVSCRVGTGPLAVLHARARVRVCEGDACVSFRPCKPWARAQP